MRIAIVSPLFESVPPKLYGGTERVVSYLTEELVRQGHQVTLFASGDSRTKASLRPVTRRGLRLDPDCRDALAYHVIMLDEVIESASEFDVIHFNIDYWHFPLSRWLSLPSVTTLHGRLDLPDLVPLYERFADMPLVSISDAQRKPLPSANWIATVHHGLPAGLFTFRERPGAYLAFLGRISPEKRPDRAIEIARRAGIPLKLAAKVDRVDRPYFEQCIRPLLTGPGVEFIGEIADPDKDRFLGEALALLFPIDWPEPFGLAMVEAMACGTPVIAYRSGSVPELMVEGVTGYIVNNEDDAVDAVRRLDRISRADCRRVFEQRYTDERMARSYLDVYQRIAHSQDRLASVA
ncbi:MAG TPA: glycosyltransferase family 4 protein [Casimicrobiaceae bacterium]|nr:glycosyltransferase family 4 protein [Casimicrobiaceae bacterium]